MSADDEIEARRRLYLQRLRTKRLRYEEKKLDEGIRLARVQLPVSHWEGAKNLMRQLTLISPQDRSWFLGKVTEIFDAYTRRHVHRQPGVGGCIRTVHDGEGNDAGCGSQPARDPSDPLRSEPDNRSPQRVARALLSTRRWPLGRQEARDDLVATNSCIVGEPSRRGPAT